MNQRLKRHLRMAPIVPFSNSDHDGRHPIDTNGQVSTGQDEIRSKIDLILDWPEESHTVISFLNGPKFISGHLTFDVDEQVPTELFLHFDDPQQFYEFRSSKRLRLNVELFRICYRFDVDTLSIPDVVSADNPVIVAMPAAITTVRSRGLPRVQVQSDVENAIGNVTWKGAFGETCLFTRVTELGLNSLVGHLDKPRQSESGTIHFQGVSVPAVYIRSKNDLPIFKLDLTSSADFGRFFEIYRRAAFPHLAPRSSIDYNTIFQLYIKTNYMRQFVGNDESGEREKLLQSTWKNVDNAQHRHSADYITLDEANDPCGASSVVRAFMSQEESIWVFHQLCSVTSPSLLDRSGQLYCWRAEYLYGFPEKLKVIGWFRSESRWLERIYVKFSQISKGTSSLRPVTWIRGDIFSSAEAGESSKKKVPEAMSIYFGDLKRTVISDNKNFAGAGPDNLNACGALNGIFNLNADPTNIGEFEDLSASLLMGQDKTNLPMHYTIAYGAEIPAGFEKHPSDRFFAIEKQDLGDFLNCVDHSIALTRRKLQR